MANNVTEARTDPFGSPSVTCHTTREPVSRRVHETMSLRTSQAWGLAVRALPSQRPEDGGTAISNRLDLASHGAGGEAPPERLLFHGLPTASPLGTPHLPSWPLPPPLCPVAHGGLLPQVRQAFGKRKWAGVSLGLTQSPSLPVGTGASRPVGTGGCGRKRR